MCLVRRTSSPIISSWGEWIVEISCVDTTDADLKAENFTSIYFFLLDVAITNAFILMKNFTSSCPFKDFKSFRLQLAKELTGEYCSRRRRGRGGTVIHSLPFWQYPIRLDDDNDGPRHPRGPCALHRDIHHRRVLSTWYCRECGEWLCHSGDPSSDCFMKWHTRLHV